MSIFAFFYDFDYNYQYGVRMKDSQNLYEKEWGLLESFLKQNGLKSTEARRTVLRVFLEQNGHVSASELYDKVKLEDPTIGSATVFRMVKLFESAAIAHSSLFEDKVVRYEKSNDHHDHLVCIRCHKVIEFHSSKIEAIQEEVAAQSGFLIKRHRLEIYGICKECQKKEVKEMTIADLKDSDKFKIKKVTLVREVGKRLADMGFISGAEGEVIRSAMLGDPLQIRIAHYDVSLRKVEAAGIEIELLLKG